MKESHARAAALIAECRALYDAIDQLDEAAARRAAISRSDLRALNALEQSSLSPSELAKKLSLTSGAVTTLIDRLEKAKLVRRKPSETDRRGVIVEPTPKMFKVLAPLYRSVAESLVDKAQRYSDKQLEAAIEHLRDVRDAYEIALRSNAEQ
ncbi:MAG: MarR family transcriptional regulator [Planctomycetota bacterium]